MSYLSHTLLGLAAVCLLGCQPVSHAAEGEPTFAATHPQRRDVDLERKYVAQVKAIQHIELRALERGYLEEIFVDEGQLVKEGQMMFQIMPLIYAAEVRKAQAEADLAKIEFQNTKLLSDKDIVSKTELSLAKAKLDKAKAELSLAATHQKLTEIHAPFSGMMDRFRVRKGSLVEEGELLTTLSDISQVWVYFNVTESDYLDYEMTVKREGPEPVELVMANGKRFNQPGKIETIEADFNNETGTIAFRATFPNPEGLLRHGETGTIVRQTHYDDALVVPQRATYTILDRRFVFVVDGDGVVHSREIEIKAEMPHLYVIASGLDEDDTIIIDGLRKVKDGDHIEFAVLPSEEAFAHLEPHAE